MTTARTVPVTAEMDGDELDALDGSFGSVYGPLAGIFALLLWALLSSIALFYGTAV
jgi:hypothetical protein